ncbi:hypothetical protein OG689_12695 [Kitasatospora sp. NBC_00240]|uniref:hypothetical protein n=1 Tax=Kitasatospora sp. NBC_00240 TaxID=2903567 RepID=UPI00224D7EDB|nr:hypothetical protein [Kitasatospora sp. NBC_00240]MCX5210139.1 hypothetical protein [Kitasatospora sp. NBC_00240]
MNRVRVDRSNPDVVDVVLREGVGPLVFAVKRWPGEVLGSLVAGAVCGAPAYAVMALAYSPGPGRIWAAVGIAALLGLVVNTFAIVYGAFRDVTRLRFSPAAAPDTMTVVRGTRTDRPRPLTDVQQIWIEHSVVESYKRDRKPVSAKVTLYVLLRNGRLVRPASLPPWTTDTTALQQELQRILAPAAVQVDLVVQRRVESVPGLGVSGGGSTGGGS